VKIAAIKAAPIAGRISWQRVFRRPSCEGSIPDRFCGKDLFPRLIRINKLSPEAMWHLIQVNDPTCGMRTISHRSEQEELMTDTAALQEQVEVRNRQAENTRQAGKIWSLDKIVFGIALGAAYLCAVLAIILPIYVRLN
jgi:hypothetical protein